MERSYSLTSDDSSSTLKEDVAYEGNIGQLLPSIYLIITLLNVNERIH